MKPAVWGLRLACACSLAACGGDVAPPTTVLVAPIPPTTVVAPAPPTSVAPSDPCDLAHARAARVLDPVMGRIADHVVIGESDDAIPAWTEIAFASLRCVSAGRGAWIALPTSSSVDYVHTPMLGGSPDPIDAFTLQQTVVIAYVAPDGAWSMGGETFQVNEVPTEGQRARIAIDDDFDFDGDGVAEALVSYDAEGYESHSVRHLLLSVAGGIVRTYPAAQDIDIERVVDADADGRPDLVSVRRYWHITPCGNDPADIGAPPVLFHSQEDGSFSASDEVATQYLREQCPFRPTTLLAPGDCGELTVRRIGCARLWGASADEVRSRLEAEQSALTPEAAEELDALTDWDVILARATIEPPVRLDP